MEFNRTKWSSGAAEQWMRGLFSPSFGLKGPISFVHFIISTYFPLKSTLYIIIINLFTFFKVEK
jgi:hypothetical protein